MTNTQWQFHCRKEIVVIKSDLVYVQCRAGPAEVPELGDHHLGLGLPESQLLEDPASVDNITRSAQQRVSWSIVLSLTSFC